MYSILSCSNIKLIQMGKKKLRYRGLMDDHSGVESEERTESLNSDFRFFIFINFL